MDSSVKNNKQINYTGDDASCLGVDASCYPSDVSFTLVISVSSLCRISPAVAKILKNKHNVKGEREREKNIYSVMV